MLPFLPLDMWQQMVPVFAKAYPREAVVAVYPDGWRELENIAAEPRAAFALCEADRIDLLTRKPLILLHSHPNGNKSPSDRDTESQMAMGIPWGIVAIDGEWTTGQIFAVHYPECWGAGLPIPPLLGRTFQWGIRDCLTLCQDFYALNGIYLPRAPRAREPAIYTKGHWGYDQFVTEPARLKLKPIKRHERKPGDMTIWQYKKDRYNHCAIYLGEGRYLHQPVDSPSVIHTTAFEEKFIESMNIAFLRPKSMKTIPNVDITSLEAITPRPLTS